MATGRKEDAMPETRKIREDLSPLRTLDVFEDELRRLWRTNGIRVTVRCG